MATVLYTALTGLTVYSPIATWFCESGSNLPLDPAKPSTIALLAAGLIELAPPDSADTSTPPDVVRGMPGLRKAVSN